MLHPLFQILVTVGGYESLHCAINAVVNPEDEVGNISKSFSKGDTSGQCPSRHTTSFQRLVSTG